MPLSDDSTGAVRVRKCCRAENKTAPKPSPSEKHEAAVWRLKPLWLCGLGGGRWRTRTSEPRACEANPAVDWRGHQQTLLENLDLAGLKWTRHPRKLPPNCHRKKLTGTTWDLWN